MLESLASDNEGGLHESSCEVTKQNPIDWKVDVGFEASAIEVDVLEIELFFKIELQTVKVIGLSKDFDESLIEVLQ